MGSCKRNVLRVLFFLGSLFVFGQEDVDSLKNYNFKDLSSKFYKHEKNKELATVYADEYLSRSKKINDTIFISNGLYFKSLISENNQFIQYNDSIIYLTKGLKEDNKFYPIIAYFNKGDFYYEKTRYDLALHNYILALNSTINQSNKDILFEIKHRIGLLKSRNGNNKEALILYKEVYDYYLAKDYDTKASSYYFPIIFALSTEYARNNMIDSAYFYTNKGFKESLALKDSVYQNYFVLAKGFILFKDKKYSEAIPLLKNSLEGLERKKDLGNIAYANYLLGETYEKLTKVDEAIVHFKKADSIYQITHDIHPDLRTGYEYVINYYNSNNNLKEELRYVKKLLEVDENLNKSYKVINKNLQEQYDTPKLLKEQDRLVNQLKQGNSLKTFTLFSSVFILIIILVLFIFQWRKRKIIEARFEKLLEDTSHQPDSTVENNLIVKLTASEQSQPKIEIPSETIDDILKQLTSFEKNHKFLEKNLKLSALAVTFNTNTKYLSAVINQYKNTNYSKYINNLRVSYAIEKLKKDSVFRSYTIKAIAEDSGFSNAESFSKAFQKKASLFPSQFIKMLQKRSLDS